MTGKPSQYFVDAVEDSVAAAHRAGGPPGDPRTRSWICGGIPHRAAKAQRGEGPAHRNRFDSSAEERYLEFLERYPSLAQRVPQWMLASYLGVSPETVSRIRKHLSRNKNKTR